MVHPSPPSLHGSTSASTTLSPTSTSPPVAEEEEPPDSGFAPANQTRSNTNTARSTAASSISDGFTSHDEQGKPTAVVVSGHGTTFIRMAADEEKGQDKPPSSTTAAKVTTGAGSLDLLQPHTLTVQQVVAHLLPSSSGTDASANGLSSAEAAARLQSHGLNQVTQSARVSAWSILVRQIANAMTLILVFAMALSFGFQHWIEGGVVTAVIALNVVLGFAQEYKAERTMANLRQLSSPTALVVRDGGVEKEIPSTNLVPGDVVLLKMGDVLPADLRLISVSNVEVDEAALTGESIPVVKHVDAIADEAARLGPGDQLNMGFASTTVTKGRGRGIVTATGMRTQLGQIATAMQASRDGPRASSASSASVWQRLSLRFRRAWEPCARLLGLRDGTPLQIRLNKFAYLLLSLAILCAIIVFSVAEFDITDEVILYAIALGVGVLPESLVAVLTITFSVGAKRMAESNVVVRKLAALESLGGVTDICTDKTGTLTTSKMVTSQIGFCLPTVKDSVQVKTYGVQRAASAYEPVGKLYAMRDDGTQIDDEKAFIDRADLPPHVKALTTAAALCNVAEITQTASLEKNEWKATGDPTEVALQVFAMKMQMGKPSLVANTSSDVNGGGFKFVQEFPFDSTIKRATFLYGSMDTSGQLQYSLFTKGAVEGVLQRCTRTLSSTDDDSLAEVDLTPAHSSAIIAQMERMASQGLRVLAFGHRHVTGDVDFEKTVKSSKHLPREEAEQDFTFLGLAGLYDPPRAETPGAIADCRTAGIAVRMLTGDHVATARAIAREIGILRGDEGKHAVMTAAEFDALSDAEIDALPDLPLVVARCSPQSKVRMIAAGRRRGRHLAMTGDGINDAPALKQAPIGIAMGSGTQIAKDCASLTLVDDRYASIVKGIREGRTVFDNIQRFLIALLVANVGEVLLLLIGLAFRDANDDSVFPLSPLAILWINMLTATAPSVGLGLEAGDKDIMRRPPHDLKAGVFSRAVITDILFYGTSMGITCLLGFTAMIEPGRNALPAGCNEDYTAGCETIYQARASVFLALTLQLLFIAWELLSMDRSFFRVQPHKRLARNPMLFWSVVACLPLIPICLYVPKLNTTVFRHAPLNGKGWGIGLAMTAAFFLLVEAWKLLARRGYWPWLTRVTGGIRRTYSSEEDVESATT